MNAIVQNIRPAPIHTEQGTTFCPTGMADKDQMLFTVNPGVDIADALQTASDLIDMALTPITEAGMGEALVDNRAWLVHHAMQSAKAAIDAVYETLKARG